MAHSILIVDDSAFSRRIVNRALPADWDVRVTEASDGKMALDLCRDHAFDVIFLDLTMPEIDGFQVLSTLRERGTKHKVFVISADVQPKARATCLELGALGFLPKPLSEKTLREMLKQHGLIQ